MASRPSSWGSEAALDLVQNELRLGRSEEFRKDILYYADRWTHLFLNQIGPLLANAGTDEAHFDLCEAVFRFQPPSSLSAPTVALIDDLDRLMGGRNITEERPVDFSQGLVDAACRLQTEMGSIPHEDPNIRLMAAISALSACWVGCLARSKLLAPLKERPELSEEDRRKNLDRLPNVATYFILFFKLGMDSAALLRAKRGQESLRDP